MPPRFQSTGAAAGNAIQQFLMQRAQEEIQRQQAEFLRQNTEADNARQDEELFLRKQQQDAALTRQATLDTQANEDRTREQSERQNTIGIQQMIGDRIQQGPVGADDARSIAGMAYGSGLQVPGVISQAMAPPKRTTVQTTDAQGRPVHKAVTEEELAAGVPDYVAPKGPAAPRAQQWVIRNGVPTPIEQGTAQAGDMPYDAVAARNEKPANNPDDAARATSDALALAKRLKTHPGVAQAYGAYEMRGWMQGAQDAKAIRDQLVAALALPNLGALKGPMSDKDILFIKSLSTRLSNDNISDQEAGLAIDEAINFLQNKLGPEAAVSGGAADPLGIR